MSCGISIFLNTLLGEDMLNKLQKIRVINLFLFIGGISILVFCAINFYRWGILKYTALSPGHEFGDYFFHTMFASAKENCYAVSVDACFPPLAYIFYYFLYRSAPYLEEDGTYVWQNYKNTDYALLVFLAVCVVFIILLNYCVTEYYKKIDSRYSLFLPLIVVLSYPVLFTGLQRGNPVLFVALCLCFSWLWIDSDSKVKQELALILIAIAFCFKIYPAIMGLIFIKRREWKKAIRLAIYGLVLFFGPFIFFGGIEGIKSFFNILMEHAGWSMDAGHFGSVRGITYYFLVENTSITESTINLVGMILENVFLIVCVVMFFLSKSRWREALFISGILVGYVGYNWAYTFVYYLPVLFLFIKEKGENTVFGNLDTAVNIILLSIIFSVPLYFYKLPGGIYEGVGITSFLFLGINIVFALKERKVLQ